MTGSSFSKKLDSFSDSLDFLLSADMEEANRSAFYRAGVVSEFVRTFELAWKAMQAALDLLPGTTYNRGSARSVMAAAAEAGFISDDEIWRAMLDDRNRSVHTYNSIAAQPLLEAIAKDYDAVLIRLRDTLKEIAAAEKDVQRNLD